MQSGFFDSLNPPLSSKEGGGFLLSMGFIPIFPVEHPQHVLVVLHKLFRADLMGA